MIESFITSNMLTIQFSDKARKPWFSQMTSQERAMTLSEWHQAAEDECVNLLYQDSYLTTFVFNGICSRPTSKPCIY